MQIGILGATGPAGRALAARLADQGEGVLVGSRDDGRARDIVGQLRDEWGDRVTTLEGVANEDAAGSADLVVIAVPWEAAGPLTEGLADRLGGKIVVSMANALERDRDGFVAIVPPERSVAAAVAKAAPEARVAAAFHHVAAKELGALDHDVEGDVLVCSDDRDAAATVCSLAERIPTLQALDVGGLGNAVGIEAFTAVMLSVNTRYKVRTGLRLTGLDR